MEQASLSGGFGLVTVIYLFVGLAAIYYLYRYLYVTVDNINTPLLVGQVQADIMPTKIPIIPTPFEGGDYSFNTWIYINSFNKNRNTRKHIFEIKGKYFSTLLVGLGAFNNTLMVRTHTNSTTSGFQSGPGTGGTGTGGTGDNRGNTNSSLNPATPNSSTTTGNLSLSAVNGLFTTLAMDDNILTAPATCDLPEIDMQRWTMITVVLSGRTIDVYMDGKLSRSCITSSYFKVDPTGVQPVITDRGGFDGYTANMSVGNYAMNPDEIYRAYLSGPGKSASIDIVSWLYSIFRGGADVNAV
jgi:hypothetical protein